ncbi:MAG: hypothetical protein ACP5M0_13965 [Desulfomonilaceae bacterium]
MRSIVILALVLLAATATGLAGAAEAIPQLQPQGAHQAAPAAPPDREKLVEAYIPPPPIRHTWPGGYRVLLHELVNTMMDHMTGHY